MTLRIEDVVFPPALPHVQAARGGAIGELALATTAAAAVFLAASMGFALIADSSLRRPDWLALGLVVLAWLGTYLAIGAALCATFMRRLKLWSGATLSQVVVAKMGFVRSWPLASPRLLWLLVLHRATGSSGPGVSG